jgi:hypothetical protein
MVCFAVVSAFLVQLHVFVPHGVASTTGDLAYKTFGTYAWSLANMIPVLDVPSGRTADSAIG